MKALDTNVVVRYLTGDDPAQAARARAAVDAGPVFVPVTVLLESEWVLRSRYGLVGKAAVEALRRAAERFGGKRQARRGSLRQG